MNDPERSTIRPTRWRATYTAEFTSHDYPVSEETTARQAADLVLKAASRGERDINASQPVVLLKNLERVDG